MRRFRLLFALLAVAILVPLGLLVGRALRSADMEKQLQYRTVAERVFDEMERTLSEMLTREEARPFDAYRAGIETELPFVVGHFQLEPDGRLGAVHGRQKNAVRDRLEATVTSYFRSGAREKPKRQAMLSQLAGTTMEVGGDRVAEKKSEVFRKDDAAPGKQRVSAFDALRSLNKGVQQRAARVSKRAQEYADLKMDTYEAESSDVMDGPAPGAAMAARGELSASDDRDVVLSEPPARDWNARVMAEQAIASPDRPSTDEAQAPVQEEVARRANELDRRVGDAQNALAHELPPMTGRMVDGQHLLLYRTLVHETRGYHQGLLVDVDRLGTWLRGEVLAGSELEAYASVAFGSAFTPPSPTRRGRIYSHRFAEPFDDLATRLSLQPLPGVGSTTYVRALALLLVGASFLGLLALYRMVSVAVAFAERRGNFVAAVSHELKTPLTAIRMYAEMLRDGIVPSDAKRDEYHRHITTEAERLSRLINNVLEFSHLEKGTRQVSLVSGPIGPVVEDVAELLRPHLAREGFELRVELDSDLPPVRFERDALIQMIFNLVDNAVKYAKDSSPRRIMVRAGREAGGVRLSVRDHGPGVPARHLGKIFEPFYRGESELTRRSKGTGIGLALVQGLAGCMGATVAGANATDGGFEVTVTLQGASA